MGEKGKAGKNRHTKAPEVQYHGKHEQVVMARQARRTKRIEQTKQKQMLQAHLRREPQ